MNKYTNSHFETNGCFKYKEWKICDIKIIRYIFNFFYTLILYLAFCLFSLQVFLARSADMMQPKYLNIYFRLITYFPLFFAFDFFLFFCLLFIFLLSSIFYHNNFSNFINYHEDIYYKYKKL